MRPTGAIEERTWPYRSGEAESEDRQRKFRVLPNGPALSCAPPVNPEDTPAGGRRSCHPTGRPPAGRPGKPRGGGASAAAPC
jgi:hypothetical protein